MFRKCLPLFLVMALIPSLFACGAPVEEEEQEAVIEEEEEEEVVPAPEVTSAEPEVTPAEPEVTPATFEVTSLRITPAEAGLGQPVAIEASIKNVGDVEGTYTAYLIIDGVEGVRKEVPISTGRTQTVTFNITQDEAGSYNIQIGEQSRVLTVEELSLSSPAFEEGDEIPVKYTGDGEDISPPLEWTEPPVGTQSFALIVDDPDAPGGIWTHWVIFNLPAHHRELSEAIPTSKQLPNGASQGENDFDDIGYGGPAPPRGVIHHYQFTLYALDQHLDLEAGVTKSRFLRVAEDHILAQSQLIGTYQR